MFAIPIAIAAPVIYGLAWGFGLDRRAHPRSCSRLAGLLGSLTVWLSRRVLEPAERLEEARRILEDAYDRARAEALRDTLTGLGNHRGLPGGDGAAVGGSDPARPAAGARHPRPRRLQADQRRARPRRRRPAPSPGRGDDATYLRRSDRAFRIGGDEFAIIMPGTDADRGQHAVRRLLAACLDGDGGTRHAALPVSFSAGISAIPGTAATATRSTDRPTPRCSGASATAGPA